MPQATSGLSATCPEGLAALVHFATTMEACCGNALPMAQPSGTTFTFRTTFTAVALQVAYKTALGVVTGVEKA
jgi:hypothetical protein